MTQGGPVLPGAVTQQPRNNWLESAASPHGCWRGCEFESRRPDQEIQGLVAASY